jgi:hypothetical protein
MVSGGSSAAKVSKSTLLSTARTSWLHNSPYAFHKYSANNATMKKRLFYPHTYFKDTDTSA